MSKFGVETNPGVSKVAVETKLSKFGVETRFNKFCAEINGRIEEANS